MANQVNRKDPSSPVPGREVKKVRAPKPGVFVEGRQIVSPQMIAPPLGYKRAPSLVEQMRAMVRSEALRREALASGMETFEEADDFDVDDDYDPHNPFEAEFEPENPPDPGTDFLSRFERAISPLVEAMGGRAASSNDDEGATESSASSPPSPRQGSAQPTREGLDGHPKSHNQSSLGHTSVAKHEKPSRKP